MAKTIGAKTIKFQLHLAEFEGTPSEPFRVAFSSQDDTRQDYWRRVNFSDENWIKLANFCRANEMEFLCTPFSLEAAKFLFENRLIQRWKIGSGQAVEWPLIDYVCKTGLPLIISTGLINEAEIQKLCDRLKENGAITRTTLLHCVSQYPAPLEHLDLHLMIELKKYIQHVGYSDHSGSTFIPMCAIAMGAAIVEVHMTPHKYFFGPDVSSSLTPEEIREIIKFAEIYKMVESSSGTKQLHYDRVSELRKLFRKGVYWSRDIREGETIQLSHLAFLKPVVHFDVIDYENLLGKKTSKFVNANNPVLPDDLS